MRRFGEVSNFCFNILRRSGYWYDLISGIIPAFTCIASKQTIWEIPYIMKHFLEMFLIDKRGRVGLWISYIRNEWNTYLSSLLAFYFSVAIFLLRLRFSLWFASTSNGPMDLLVPSKDLPSPSALINFLKWFSSFTLCFGGFISLSCTHVFQFSSQTPLGCLLTKRAVRNGKNGKFKIKCSSSFDVHAPK